MPRLWQILSFPICLALACVLASGVYSIVGYALLQNAMSQTGGNYESPFSIGSAVFLAAYLFVVTLLPALLLTLLSEARGKRPSVIFYALMGAAIPAIAFLILREMPPQGAASGRWPAVNPPMILGGLIGGAAMALMRRWIVSE